MITVTIIGAGNMGAALASLAITGGNPVQVLARDEEKAQVHPSAATGVVGDAVTGDIVILALPYPAVADVLSTYAGQLDGKILVDLTNPLDFATFDSLVVPADSSAAAEIATQAPASVVLKAFNTNFAATLASGTVGDAPTTVLVAGDDADAKATLIALVEAGGLAAVDAGSLRRARELEALGFLQLTLAAGEKISWAGGFALTK
ncbi:putative dinucleotide-binding enzyme [Okibacterium sp. HSC-33S16]|uniref:NADPH-dependent F420 reductase n=1 Tax=Okibacterium sp. HSC-33S16 TaxID=2910965 RepID=UPI00209FA222|nr:NADPH-dependent F420 reductase [Okibacterium sp. HSC-33S16]MCP2030968.1 putative dinucleotide-binding enzyme [Okibacterium sp. HSC-33S16]